MAEKSSRLGRIGLRGAGAIPRVDMRQLAYFVTVVELGSITKAARQLNIAQPALGSSIRKLEEKLGAKLLIRHSRGIETTEAGAAFVDRARDILDRIWDAEAFIREFSGEPRGKVIVGVTPSVALTIGASLFDECRRQYPGVELVLVEDLSNIILEWLDDSRLDIAMAYEANSSKVRSCEKLASEDLYFITPWRDGSTDDVGLAEAVSHPLLIPGAPHALRDIVELNARRLNLELRVAHEVQSIPIIRDLVERGVAPAILPLGAVKREVEANRLSARRIVDPNIERTLYMLRGTRRPPSNAESVVSDLLRSVVREEICARQPSGMT